jgi:hypothetical protein
MARSSVEIIEVLRRTAAKIQASQQYQWGHMGLCNCGFLAQEITKLKKEDIHSRAMQRYGDWSEQLNDYCATSGIPMDDLISDMLNFGFDRDDLKNLERLSDPLVLARFPLEERNLSHNVRDDVVKYLEAWAAMLEQDLVERIMLPSYLSKEVTIL